MGVHAQNGITPLEGMGRWCSQQAQGDVLVVPPLEALQALVEPLPEALFMVDEDATPAARLLAACSYVGEEGEGEALENAKAVAIYIADVEVRVVCVRK